VAVIQLSLRFQWSDIFWFNFFHELGHVLLHLTGGKRTFLDDKNFATSFDSEEAEANHFAATTLIPPDAYEEFLHRPFWQAPTVQEFADQINLDPGIIVGRLQFDKHLHYGQLVELKSRFEWV